MSLFKQIQLLITLLLLFTLIIVLWINFDNTRKFSTNQSFFNAKNVANVLALSLSARPTDQTFMQTGINAMFDGGYYQSITFFSQDGSVLYEKNEPLAVQGVPVFFPKLIKLHIPPAQARVMNGWLVYGTLKVQGHTGITYQKLWATFKQLCLLFIVLGSAAILISFIILKYLLKALRTIQHQAEAISNNEFISNPAIPKTTELKDVVLAMNTMVKKVQTIFDRHLNDLIQFQTLRYKDKITGLHNRSFFVKKLAEILEDKQGNTHGQVVLIGITGIERGDISGGKPLVHTLFKHLGKILEKEISVVENAVAARFPRQEFAAILPGCKQDKGTIVARAVTLSFLKSIGQETKGSDTLGAFTGISSYKSEDDLSTILSKADYALSLAKTGLPGTIKRFKEEQMKTIFGKSEWQALIEDAFLGNRFFLTAQPVMSDAGEFHREIFINLVDSQGVHHEAGLFMPMVMGLRFANRLDQYVLAHSVKYLEENPKGVLAVNISTEFSRDRLAFSWFRQFLFAHKSIQNRLFFEIHESVLVQHPEICIDFTGLIKGLGYHFGVDQFTMNEASLSLLDKIKPFYIKIEPDYLEVFDDPGKADMVLNALFTISDSLGIRLIATKIENEAQRAGLAKKNIHYFQGHSVAKIAPLRN